MATWEETIQDWGSRVLDAGIAFGVTNPYEVKKLKLQALGDFGFYEEGKPGVSGRQSSLVVPPGLLLLGGAALLIFLLKD